MKGLALCRPGSGSARLEVLDEGCDHLHPAALADALNRCSRGKARVRGFDRNAVCYLVHLPGGEGPFSPLVVKAPRDWEHRTNPDCSFAREAANLSRLASFGVDRIPRMMGRFRLNGTCYLVLSHIEGAHPGACSVLLTPTHLRSMAGWCLNADRLGFLHYDLKPENLLVHDHHIRIIDFEFGRFEGSRKCSSRLHPAWCNDYNVSMNPYLPGRTNVANFEFRTLDRLCGELELTSPPACRDLLAAWLQAKAGYHRETAGYLASTEPARNAAVEHELLLAELYGNPEEEVIAVERLLMKCRARTFHHQDLPAARMLREAQGRIRRLVPSGRDGTAGAYREAALNVAARLRLTPGRG